MLVADHVETTQHRGLTKLYTTEDGRFQLVPETLTFPELTSVSYSNSPYKALKRSDSSENCQLSGFDREKSILGEGCAGTAPCSEAY
eukprot:scaffold7866_cov138-Cylindrotheca_fusiformis.AAC.1